MATRAASKRAAALESTLSTPITNKRKRAQNTKNAKESVKGDWDVLPHGLGKKGDLLRGFDDPATQQPDLQVVKRARGGAAAKDEDGDTTLDPATPQPGLPADKRARRRAPVKDEDVNTALPDIKREDLGDTDASLDLKLEKKLEEANGGTIDVGAVDVDLKEETVEDATPKTKRSPPKKKANLTNKAVAKPDKKPPTKRHLYGLTPGVSPFPNHAKPTKEDCYEVNRLLSKAHGEVKAPEVIPPPSLEVTGCGEVPDLLEALLRTLLSAATTSKNSGMALDGLLKKFGVRASGFGVNWEAIHKASLDDVIAAIKSGGLAKTKGTNIKKILAAVYERNLDRVKALTNEKTTGEPADIPGAKHETQSQKDAELARLGENMLSLDYLFELTTDEVMDELTKLPGIGVKTSSCVILFCMQRPSFAVDTHVWRHCKWLGWVPETADRDKTFRHCEVMVPDELKYSLHQLFIAHGKKCARCKAGTSPGSDGWETTVCPIEHLVKRTGKMKDRGRRIETEDEDGAEDDDGVEAEESELSHIEGMDVDE